MPDDEKQRRVELGIWIYLAVFFILTIFAWIPFLLHGRSSHTFPLGDYGERFSDLTHFANVPQKLAEPNLEDNDLLRGKMFPRNYGPLAAIVYLFLLKVCSPYSVVVFLAVVVSAFALAAFRLWRSARRSPGYRPFMLLAIFGTSLLAYPTAVTELRGNIEGLVWIGYAVGIGLMWSRKWGTSASVLAITSCVKPYPMLFILVQLFRRKYKQVVAGCLILVVTTIGCLALVGRGNPKQGLAATRGGSSTFFANYIVGFRNVREVAADHSLFQTSKSIARVVKARSFQLPARDLLVQASLRIGYILLAFYLPLAGLSLLFIFWRLRKKAFLNQIFSLSICLTLFPLLAADYTLPILYIPMGLFLLFLLRDVTAGRACISQGRLMGILVPCAWLMTPQPWFGIWAGDVRSILLLFLLFMVMNTPMPMEIDLKPAHWDKSIL